jgi:hypothetical protein
MKLLDKTTLRIALLVLGLLQFGWGIKGLRAQDCSGPTNCYYIDNVNDSYCIFSCSGCCSNGSCCCVWVGHCADWIGGGGGQGEIFECCSGCQGGIPIQN